MGLCESKTLIVRFAENKIIQFVSSFKEIIISNIPVKCFQEWIKYMSKF